MIDAAPRLRPERPDDAPALEALVARAFGPGRFAKVSERVREQAAHRLDLSVVAEADGALLGCARQWEIAVGGRPAIFLGPLAVAAEHRRHGTARALVSAAVEAARAAGEAAVLLVGNPPLFAPCGFVRAPAEVRLPGPVDPARTLLCVLDPAAPPFAGPVAARR